MDCYLSISQQWIIKSSLFNHAIEIPENNYGYLIYQRMKNKNSQVFLKIMVDKIIEKLRLKFMSV